MTEAQANWCHAVAAEFKSRWVEQEEGEAYTMAESLLQEGQATTETNVDDAVRQIDRRMG